VRTWLSRLGGEGGVFLAIMDGNVVGFGALDYNTIEPDTVVLGVWMLPEVRRRGIGTALAEYALGFARDKGYKRIRGRLPQDNEVALTFLSSIGACAIYNPEARFEPLGLVARRCAVARRRMNELRLDSVMKSIDVYGRPPSAA
jgi:GNAT superfamily N-acetyltransferase